MPAARLPLARSDSRSSDGERDPHEHSEMHPMYLGTLESPGPSWIFGARLAISSVLMFSIRRTPAEIAQLRQRRDELSMQVNELRKERDLETRVEFKLAQDAALKERENRLADAEDNLAPFEIVEKADDLERKSSWEAAIAAWERIAKLRPAAVEPAIEIVRLRAIVAFEARRLGAIADVFRRRDELGDFWPELRLNLNELRPGAIGHEIGLMLIAEFREGKLDATSFIGEWRTHRAAQASAATPPVPAIGILAGRLQRGDIALFLGSGIASGPESGAMDPEKVAEELARLADMKDIVHNLATVAEYYHLSLHGRGSLLQNLRPCLATDAEIPFYDLLAGIAAPLVIVSACWDSLLERAFRLSGKPFAVVAPRLSLKTGTAELIVVRSDQDRELSLPADSLSGLKLLERYSLIFKTRGTLVNEIEGLENVAPVTVAERDHFAFARRQQVLLPTYLMRLLGERGLLILGLSARHWEDRLLLDAVLDRRQAAERPLMAGPAPNGFETAFWQEHTRRIDVPLPELVAQLAAHLRSEGRS